MKTKRCLTTTVAFILCGLLLIGCQATPEKQAVVQKKEDIPSEAIKQADGPAETAEHYEPMPYKASEHWKENITKSEDFIINADVDVMMPEAEVYPVQKLSQMDMTQERVDELIAYFVGSDAEFYQMPLPMTKEDWEERILELKQSLAQAEAGGDGEEPELLHGYIKEAEEGWANAPEENEMKAADTKFTYRLDYETGRPTTEEGKNLLILR